jgi:hypothetical protein
MARYPHLAQSSYIQNLLWGSEVWTEGIMQTAWSSAREHLELACGWLRQPKYRRCVLSPVFDLGNGPDSESGRA